MIGPGWFSYDTNLQKDFPIFHERMKLSVRVDVFNVFNHPNLSTPDVGAADATFGQVLTAAGAYQPRTLQFGARLDFLDRQRESLDRKSLSERKRNANPVQEMREIHSRESSWR